jgi:hypothetical protein
VNWRIHVRTAAPFRSTQLKTVSSHRSTSVAFSVWPVAGLSFVLLLVLGSALPSAARKKDTVAYGEGLIVNIPLPEPEVAAVVQDIAANGIIRGTKEYNKDEFVGDAKPAFASTIFPEWKQGGSVFYKVRTEALDPRNFKDSQDLGTLVVRYVVIRQGAKNTVLRIDALFKEDFRGTVHLSNGSVESNEYRDIQDHLDFLELMKKQDVEATRERQAQLAKKQNAPAPTGTPTAPVTESSSSNVVPAADNPAPAPPVQPASSPSPTPAVGPPGQSANSSVPEVAAPAPAQQVLQPVETAVATPPPAAATPQPPAVPTNSPETLQQRVKDLKTQVERIVKSPGAPLKSAPFHTAINLQTLKPGTEVLIVISTPYWYGVETHEGQHGWIMRDDVEQP